MRKINYRQLAKQRAHYLFLKIKKSVSKKARKRILEIEVTPIHINMAERLMTVNVGIPLHMLWGEYEKNK